MKMTAFNFVHFADVVQTVHCCKLQRVCEASGHSIYAGPWVNYTDALSRIINIWVVSMAIY